MAAESELLSLLVVEKKGSGSTSKGGGAHSVSRLKMTFAFTNSRQMQHVPKSWSENGAFSPTGHSKRARYPLAAKYS